MNILLIDDNSHLAEELQKVALAAGLKLSWAPNAPSAEQAFADSTFGAVILDAELDSCDTTEYLQRILRERETAVIVTTVEGMAARIRWLGQGADDAMTKPFSLAELVARVKASMRRWMGRSTNVYKYKFLTLEYDTRRVLIDGHAVPTTVPQWSLLEMLARRNGEALPWETAMKVCGVRPGAKSNRTGIRSLRDLSARLLAWGHPHILHVATGRYVQLMQRKRSQHKIHQIAALRNFILHNTNLTCPRDYEVLASMVAANDERIRKARLKRAEEAGKVKQRKKRRKWRVPKIYFDE
jgi:DNA-binding response OmpR family regulator